MNNRIILQVISILILASCSSTNKMLRRADYDSLIDKSVKNLIRRPTSEEDAIMLDKCYKLANDRDLERITYLKREGNPDTWDEVFTLYERLKYRQNLVRKVMPIQIDGQKVQYEIVDYDAQLIAAKRNAADYYNAHAVKLMENRDKESYRQAYYELQKAKEYSGGAYLDLDRRISEARYLGMSRVLVNIVNRTIINLPQEFTNGLIAINASEMNSEWVAYYTRKLDNSMSFDYNIDIVLQSINVSPDQVQNKDYIEKTTVEDGFQYVLDAKGNVMKDTAGNDIKVKKYKDLQCTVIEELQLKDCVISGEIQFLSTNPSALLKTQPIGANTHFEHRSARAIGDLGALTDETKKLVAIKPVPFPDDVTMIIDCTEALKNAIHEAIRYNRGLMK